jgi:hypothetical protein
VQEDTLRANCPIFGQTDVTFRQQQGALAFGSGPKPDVSVELAKEVAHKNPKGCAAADRVRFRGLKTETEK